MTFHLQKRCHQMENILPKQKLNITSQIASEAISEYLRSKISWGRAPPPKGTLLHAACSHTPYAPAPAPLHLHLPLSDKIPKGNTEMGCSPYAQTT